MYVYIKNYYNMFYIGKMHNILVGKDSSRSLAITSLNEEDARPEYEDLNNDEVYLFFYHIYIYIDYDYDINLLIIFYYEFISH